MVQPLYPHNNKPFCWVFVLSSFNIIILGIFYLGVISVLLFGAMYYYEVVEYKDSRLRDENPTRYKLLSVVFFDDGSYSNDTSINPPSEHVQKMLSDLFISDDRQIVTHVSVRDISAEDLRILESVNKMVGTRTDSA